MDLPGRLGLGRGVTARIVAEALLTPVLAPDAEYELKERQFLREDVDGPIDRCLDGAEMVDEAPPGFANLRRAASECVTGGQAAAVSNAPVKNGAQEAGRG